MQRNTHTSKHILRAWFCLLALCALVFLAACGSNTTTTGAGSTPAASSNTPSNNGYGNGYGGGKYGNGGGNTTPTAPPSTSGALIHTATATVSGKSETILTNAQGLTLYYRDGDTPTSSGCTGGCADTWPPLIVTGTPTSSTSLPGRLTAQQSGNGNQVAYNGHLLYTYTVDSAPGQTNGEGAGGIWHVATPNLSNQL